MSVSGSLSVPLFQVPPPVATLIDKLRSANIPRQPVQPDTVAPLPAAKPVDATEPGRLAILA